ncbi:MAG: cation-transporting P-type ATPase [Zoogloeaceae bacterium]|nr:cation-transporting P-type ATPase [Zoogloeaceae bacterium]
MGDSNWHALSGEQVVEALSTSISGLSGEEARGRLARYGPNQLPPPPRASALQRFLLQFHNVLIYVLLVAGMVTALLGHWVDSGVIVGVVLINAVIGFIQEGKAEKALDAVRAMLSPRAVALRDGQKHTIDATELVPGDVVWLQSGDRVPADLRLIRLKELNIDEALLTGESVPASKRRDAVAADAVIGDRVGMAWSGTLVTSGQGAGVVVATGERTEIGRISAMLQSVQVLETPLLRQMSAFARVLTGAILVIALFAFAFGTLVRDYSAVEMFMAAVGLAVAAIPEGLPAIITITLAIGVQRMARRSAIIRRLPAVETLGAVTVVCSDKTGTLTRNEMTAQQVAIADGHFEITGGGYDPHGDFICDGRTVDMERAPTLMEIARAGLLCNDAGAHSGEDGQWHFDGDPTEMALLVLAVKAGLNPHRTLEQYPRIDVIPFESEHKFMATLHHDHAGHRFLCVKGAPEVLFSRCTHERSDGEDGLLDLRAWHDRVHAIAADGQRTLAIAVKVMPPELEQIDFRDVDEGLTLLGVVGIMDPPRDEAIRAVAACHTAGIDVKMITGDHATTAMAIGRRLGLSDTSHALTGVEIEAMSDAELREVVRHTDVFARVSPEHKLRLVEAIQASGDVAAMTGDGVNDAPALKRADVGVAMGLKGTEAAKEAAEMVLADDNFASIEHAIEEGRTVYDNIKKSILFILPTNGGEALTILAAIALGRSLPVTAAQILWVNMITAVTLALSLAFEPAEAGIMRRHPRDPRAPILNGFMIWRILFVSVLMVVGTFGLYIWAREGGADVDTARTVAVNTLVVLEAFYLFNSRYLLDGVLNMEGLFGNRKAVLAAVLVIFFQLLYTYAPPMQLMFHSRPLGWLDWALIFGAGLILLLLVELEKAVLRRLGHRAVL